MNKNEKFVITINREVGSGGRTVGRKLAEKLGVKYCDKAVIDGLTQKFGLSPDRIEKIKAQKSSWIISTAQANKLCIFAVDITNPPSR